MSVGLQRKQLIYWSSSVLNYSLSESTIRKS